MADRCERIVDRLAKEYRGLNCFLDDEEAERNVRVSHIIVLPTLRIPTTREECYKSLAMEDGSLDEDRRFLAEVCAFCSDMYRILDEEWVAHATLVEMVLSRQYNG